MLSFRLFHNKSDFELPISLYSCGLHHQHAIYRPDGFPTFQIMICFSGFGTFRFGNKPFFKMSKGDMLLIPGQVPHEYHPSNTEQWIMGYMGIKGGSVDVFIKLFQLPTLQTITVGENELKWLEKGLRKLWHISEKEGEEEHYRIASAKLYHILAYVASMRHHDKSKQQVRNTIGAKESLHAAVQFMEQHYNEGLNMANIAYTVGYSKQHFQRKFKEVYGINPSQYLQRLRLTKGAELLQSHSDLTVGEIAAMVGMELNYFVRLFKRKYDITPARYRSSCPSSNHPSSLTHKIRINSSQP